MINKELNSTELSSKNTKEFTEKIKKLKEETQLGYKDCSDALKETNGDYDSALIVLQAKSLAGIGKRLARETKEGTVATYMHKNRSGSPQLAAMIELCCETNFVSKNLDFVEVAKNLAMHIAVQNPKYAYKADMPKEIWDKEIEIVKSNLKQEYPNKENEEIENIAIRQVEQNFIFECQEMISGASAPNQTISDYLASNIALFRENIRVRRFARFSIQDEV